MARTREVYNLTELTLAGINRVLARLAARLDRLEGVSGNPDFGGKVLKNVGRGSRGSDAARRDDL